MRFQRLKAPGRLYQGRAYVAPQEPEQPVLSDSEQDRIALSALRWSYTEHGPMERAQYIETRAVIAQAPKRKRRRQWGLGPVWGRV